MKNLTSSPLLIRYQHTYDENPDSLVFAPLAEAYRKLGMLDEAQTILLKGTKLHPNYSLGLLVLANCYADLDQFEEVYKTLESTAQKDKNNIKIQKLFAESCVKTSRTNEALEAFKYLLFINPKDKKIAKNVKKLESSKEIEQIIETPLKPSTVFNIDQIGANPEEYDYDDWRQEDFAFSENEETIDDNTWAMTDNTEEPLKSDDVEQDEDGRTFSFNTELIKNSIDEEIPEEDFNQPVVTHTLVDLYCAQGYLWKAKEILEKILALNPSDDKTQKKLVELQALLGTESSDILANSEDDEVEDLDTAEFLSREIEEDEPPVADDKKSLMNYFDEKLKENQTEPEETNKDDKILKLKLFLERIKKKASARSDSGPAATP